MRNYPQRRRTGHIGHPGHESVYRNGGEEVLWSGKTSWRPFLDRAGELTSVVQIAYSLFLNTIEIISLCNPQPTLLIHHFPWVFCTRGSMYSPMLQMRFPRLPSAYLAVCECVAVSAGIWNATLFINKALEDRTWDFKCPESMCLAPEVYRMISGYILEVMIGLFHIGFFFMAVGHLVKRKADGWMRALEK